MPSKEQDDRCGAGLQRRLLPAPGGGDNQLKQSTLRRFKGTEGGRGGGEAEEDVRLVLVEGEELEKENSAKNEAVMT